MQEQEQGVRELHAPGRDTAVTAAAAGLARNFGASHTHIAVPSQQQPSQQPQNRLGGLMSFGKKQLSPPSAQGQIAQGAGA